MFVGDNYARFEANVVKHLAQEALCCVLITSRLHQDVQHNAVLIDGPPQPVASPIDLLQDFVKVPLVVGPCSSPTERSGEGGTKLRAPLTDRLMADDDAPLGEQILNVAEDEVETKVRPGG